MARDSILIVEDNADIRSTLRHLFELEGYEVRLAENGEDALEHLDEGQAPCLILLDLAMPRMDGWQFLEALQGMDSDASRAPVAVLSAQVDSTTARELKQRFGCRVIAKPAPIRTLLGVAKHCSERLH
jgi:CheY-like chemotaxis protein